MTLRMAAWLWLLPALLGAADAPVRLEGVVTNQITGEPVKKAVITISAETGIAAASVTSDASGQFIVRELPPGLYFVTAQHPSYLSQPFSGNLTSVRKSITVKAGEPKQNVALTVVPAASISGRVVDADGDPVQNCQMQLMRITTLRGRRRLISLNAENTNANGDFEVGELAPGKYYVLARFHGEPLTAHPLQPLRREPPVSGEGYVPQFYPGSTDLSGATALSLEAGSEIKGIDFRLKKRAIVTLRIRLTGPEEAVTPETQVQLRPNDPMMGDDGSNQTFATRQPNGNYVIPYVTAGSYVLSAFTYSQKNQYVATQQITVGTEPPDPILVTLHGGIDIAGTLEVESDQKAGLQNLRVRLEAADLHPAGNQSGGALNGTAFVLAKVTPGRWRVIVDNLFGLGYIKSIRYGDQDAPSGVIDVQEGAGGPLRLVVSQKGGTIEGSIERGGDKTLGVEVNLIPEGERAEDASLYRSAYVRSLGQPSYRFEQLPPGAYRLFALEGARADLVDNTEWQKAMESRSERVTVDEGGRVSRNLKAISSAEAAEISKP